MLNTFVKSPLRGWSSNNWESCVPRCVQNCAWPYTQPSAFVTAGRAVNAVTEIANILLSKSIQICAISGQTHLNTLFHEMQITVARERNRGLIHPPHAHTRVHAVSLWALASSSVFISLHTQYTTLRDIYVLYICFQINNFYTHWYACTLIYNS